MKLDTPPKVAAVLALLAYVIGVLSVSIYAQGKDIPAPDLTAFKANYIYTGLQLLGLLAAGAGVVYVSTLVYRLAAGKLMGISAWAAAGLTAVVVAFLLWWIFYVLVVQGGFRHSHALTAAKLVIASVFFGAFGMLGWDIWKADTLEYLWLRRDLREFAVALAVGLALTAALVFVFQYSYHLYKQIPRKFGGGEPEKALMLFTKTGAREAQQLGIPLRRGSQKSEPVTILLVDESFYAVKALHSAVVQIAKSSVDGLQVDSKPPFGVDVQAPDRGEHRGRPEVTDRLVLTYDETMDPGSLVKGWSGKEPWRHKVQLKVNEVDGHDQLQFVESDDLSSDSSSGDSSGDLALGTINMTSDGYDRYFNNLPIDVHAVSGNEQDAPSVTHLAVTLRQHGPKIIIVLRGNPAPPTGPEIKSDTMTWTPSSKAADLTGNDCLDDEAPERRHGALKPADDPDF
jgi:hypothetical protein